VTSFEDQLAQAAADAPLNEALAGLKRIAEAAGIFEQTWQARSIAEVCDLIAAWCTAHRSAWDDPQVMTADLRESFQRIWDSGGPWGVRREYRAAEDITAGQVVEEASRYMSGLVRPWRGSGQPLGQATADAAANEPVRLRRPSSVFGMDKPQPVSPAAALKAALVTASGAPPVDLWTLILDAAAAQLAAGGPMWTLRCSWDIARAERFPGMLGVEINRDWQAGRWELRDAAGSVIVTSGDGT
jgi:hypothetical protein